MGSTPSPRPRQCPHAYMGRTCQFQTPGDRIMKGQAGLGLTQQDVGGERGTGDQVELVAGNAGPQHEVPALPARHPPALLRCPSGSQHSPLHFNLLTWKFYRQQGRYCGRFRSQSVRTWDRCGGRGPHRTIGTCPQAGPSGGMTVCGWEIDTVFIIKIDSLENNNRLIINNKQKMAMAPSPCVSVGRTLVATDRLAPGDVPLRSTAVRLGTTVKPTPISSFPCPRRTVPRSQPSDRRPSGHSHPPLRESRPSGWW